MEEIIEKIDRVLIKEELKQATFIRHTRKCNNEIYVIEAHQSPNIMNEIGRLREIAFRSGGGGTGKSVDIDEFDLMTPPCRQLFVWDPEKEEILGGYRFILGKDIKFNENGLPRIAMSHLFEFSQDYIENYLPYTIELGRSFVALEYQSSKAGAKGLFALDNLWDGLGALVRIYPQTKYLLGKFTMYTEFPVVGRNMIMNFLRIYFPDRDNLIKPHYPLDTTVNDADFESLFCKDDYKKDYLTLNSEIRNLGANIPPLVSAYMALSPSMKTFGTAINDEFGDVEETGMLITVEDIYPEKRARHIESYSEDDVL
ncbi:MAG: GNAT family N-acetyltransferase [Bacteroidales bacterium]|nr:GNAT family N-acetyltransferase [Bacteroidales bacterium]